MVSYIQTSDAILEGEPIMSRKRVTARKGKTPGHGATYSKFRVRWRHVLLIDQRIRSGRGPNCRQLAEELEVSRRTVLRDVDFLRYDLGAPIEYDPDRRGYVYTEPNWVMPTVRITEGELFALLVAEKALEAYSGTPWAERLQRIFDRMVTSLPDRIEVAPREQLPRISFDAGAVSLVDPTILETVGTAIRDNETLRIRYSPLHSGRTKGYTIDPYMLRQTHGAWYLVGRDHPTGHIPMFNVSRMISVQPTGATFDYEAAEFDAKGYFEETFGVYETTRRYRCAIEFSGVAARLVRERRWHAQQDLKELPAGRLRFEVTVSHLDDIWPWVLGWGAEAKVIRPKELKERVTKQAAGILTRYRKKRTSPKSRGGRKP